MSTVLNTQNTAKFSVTNASTEYDLELSNTTVVRVISNRAIHVLVARSGPASTDDTRIAAECAEFIRINPGEKIYYIRDDSETDGEIWFTKQVA